MSAKFEVAVVGAGIIGLAHAYHLGKAGKRVAVFERHPRACGASVRNFGMLWPIGQPAGPLYQLARRSVSIWKEILRGSDLWHDPCGSLHLAYHEDEQLILQEFAEQAGTERPGKLLWPGQITSRYPAVRPEGLRRGWFSPTEITVDPRQVIAELPAWLTRTFGITFFFDAQVTAFDRPRIITTAGDFEADQLLVCTGADFRELAPEAFAGSGLKPCKLQMMRSQPYDSFRLGPMLAAGLTLRHYKAFANCPTLPDLIRRLDAEMPDYARFGIHVMAAQNGRGEVVLGDSHEYGDAIEPFDKAEIDELILTYLNRFVNLPDLRIAARWHGVYVKHPTESYLIAEPRPGMKVVNGVGGAGMTLSFGLAEQVVTSLRGATQ